MLGSSTGVFLHYFSEKQLACTALYEVSVVGASSCVGTHAKLDEGQCVEFLRARGFCGIPVFVSSSVACEERLVFIL